MQYTIHFINECDLFIRKLQQKYQLKNIPLLNNEPSVGSTLSKITTSKSVELDGKIQSVLGAEKKQQQNGLPPPQPTQVSHSPYNDLNSVNTLLNDESSSSSTSSACSYTTTSSNSSVNASIFTSVVRQHQLISNAPHLLSKPLIKAMPMLASDGSGGIMTAQTKGGASQDGSSSNNSTIDDKDLVSLRLRQNVFNSGDGSGGGGGTQLTQRTKNKIDPTFLEITNQNKRPRMEKASLHSIGINDSNAILLDSDSDEDDTIFVEINNDDEVNFVQPQAEPVKPPTPPPVKSYKSEQVASDNLFDENDLIKKETLSGFKIKKCFIRLEELNMEQIKNSHGIKFNESPTKKQPPSRSTSPRISFKKSPAKNCGEVKRFRSRSKTFPQNERTFVEHVARLVPATPLADLDLDAITCFAMVSTTRAAASQQQVDSSNELTTRSKTRSANNGSQNNSNTSNNNLPRDLRDKLNGPAKSASAVVETGQLAPSLDGNNIAPPSPAELLRKYSATAGYTCEMDKLFRGSSITVTQCLECENLRKCPESFYDRSIPIDTNNDVNENEDESVGVNWISKCLSNESYLNENSKYMCDVCTSQQEAKIHTQYTQLPSILVLHLLSYGITSR